MLVSFRDLYEESQKKRFIPKYCLKTKINISLVALILIFLVGVMKYLTKST